MGLGRLNFSLSISDRRVQFIRTLCIGSALPRWLIWLLTHLHVSIEGVSATLVYNMRELGSIGGERALVCSFKTLCLEPNDRVQMTTLALLGMGLAVLLPDAGEPQPILHDLSVRLSLVHSSDTSLLVPSAVDVAAGAGEGLTQPVKLELDAARMQALTAAQALLHAGLVLRTACRKRLLPSEPAEPGEADYTDALSLLPASSRSPLNGLVVTGARATVAAAGVQLVLKLDDGSEVGRGNTCNLIVDCIDRGSYFTIPHFVFI